MDDKIKILIDKIGIDEEHYTYFNDAKITKIKVNSKTNSWNIFIDKDELLPIDIYEELESKKMNIDPNVKKIEIIFNIKNINLNTLLSYYKYLLVLLKKDLKVLEIYEDCLRVEDDKLVLITTTEVEKERLEKVLNKITKFYKKLSYETPIEIVLRHEDNVLEEIQEELNNIELPKIDGVTVIRVPESKSMLRVV